MIFVLAFARATLAIPPAPGKRFDCGDSPAGTTSCATDDAGCVPNAKRDPSPAGTIATELCGDALGKALTTAIRAVLKCHKRQADDRFRGWSAAAAGAAEDACQNGPKGGKSAKERLDAAIAKIAPRCTPAQLALVAAEEAMLFADASQPGSLDRLNGDVYCDSTAGALVLDPGGDDAGFLPRAATELGCADAVGVSLGRLVAAVVRCHRKMTHAFFAGKDFDERACEELDPVRHRSALERYAAAMGRLDASGTCTQPCLDRPHRDALGASVLASMETANQAAYPCPSTTTTSTTTTTAPIPTTTTTTSTTATTTSTSNTTTTTTSTSSTTTTSTTTSTTTTTSSSTSTTTTSSSTTTSVTLPVTTTSLTLPVTTTSLTLPITTTTTSTTTTTTATTLCPSQAFTFSMTSSTGGPFSDASWPGGQATQCASAGCCVTLNQPSGDIVLVGNVGDHWSVAGFTGFSSCSLSGACATNGGTCTSCTGVDAPISCPPAGIPNCTSNRPSCSSGLNGSATDRAHVQCAP